MEAQSIGNLCYGWQIQDVAVRCGLHPQGGIVWPEKLLFLSISAVDLRRPHVNLLSFKSTLSDTLGQMRLSNFLRHLKENQLNT